MKKWCICFKKPAQNATIQLSDSILIEAKRDALECRVYTQYEGKALAFTLSAPLTEDTYTLLWLGYSVRLYVGESLADEDWPLGDVAPFDGAGYSYTENPFVPAETESAFTGPMQFFTPPGRNTGTGDCMPFSRDGRYCLYYLLDRRGHRSKTGLGAHQWAQISSSDLRTWTIHPMAIPITEQWEGSICTGSLIQKGDLIYAFYAVRMSDHSPAGLTWAVSEDGVHFTKSGKSFSLRAPYEPVSARDPKVFRDEEGLYHMLVTTNLTGEDAPEYPGCLAHLTSPDLESWQQHEPFIVPGYTDQPECSDYFHWGDKYYLVFANHATARYRVSDKPFGPWMKPENDILDTRVGRVAKTAAFGERRFVSSFLSTYPETYAGYGVTHELFRKEDGSLGVKFLPEILPEDGETVYQNAILRVKSQATRGVSVLGTAENFRLRMRLAPSSPATRFGVRLKDENGEAYHIDMNAAQRRVCISRPGQDFAMGEMRNQLLGLHCMDGAFAIDLLVYKDALDMAVGSDRIMTMRIPRKGKFQIALYAMDGDLTAENILLAENIW